LNVGELGSAHACHAGQAWVRRWPGVSWNCLKIALFGGLALIFIPKTRYNANH
jgi:hypothetical protein